MAIEAATEYLEKLLNRSITADTALRLSSAQRARFNAWLSSQGLAPADGRLGGEFSLTGLFSGVPVLSPTVAAGTVSSSGASGSSLAVGIDIQSIGELMGAMQDADLKANPEMLRLFTLRELSYAQAREKPADTLAGLFAAKEAMRKCIGGPNVSPEAFRDLEVLPDSAGRPIASGYEISISHSGDFAVAVAIRMPEPSPPVMPPPAVATPIARDRTRWLFLSLLMNAILMFSILMYLLAGNGR